MDIKSTGPIKPLKSLFPDKSSSGPKKMEPDSVLAIRTRLNEMKVEILAESKDNFATQSGLSYLINNKEFDVSTLQYNGRSILELSPEEATDLISEDGFYGVKNTAGRLSGFVVDGAGNDLEKLKAGREGVVRGFKEAEQLWGGQLPDISYETFDLALQQIDARIQELGGSVISTRA